MVQTPPSEMKGIEWKGGGVPEREREREYDSIGLTEGSQSRGAGVVRCGAGQGGAVQGKASPKSVEDSARPGSQRGRGSTAPLQSRMKRGGRDREWGGKVKIERGAGVLASQPFSRG